MRLIEKFLVAMALFLWSQALLPASVAQASHCNLTGPIGVVPRVERAEKTFYGVRAQNKTTDVAVCDAEVDYESVWVNSIYVRVDNDNLVELGWVESPNRGRVAFGVRIYFGDYDEYLFGPVAANTDHLYKLVSRPGPLWRYWVDGTLELEVSHWFRKGHEIWAAQERHSTSEIGDTHWWDLKQSDNKDLTFSNWPSWSPIFYGDPYYPYYKVCRSITNPNTDFWVKPESEPCPSGFYEV